MTKVLAITRLDGIALRVLIVVCLGGCISTAQPEHPVQVVDTAEPLPVIKSALQPQSETKVITAEPDPTSEVDEKTNVFFTLGSSTVGNSERDKLHALAKLLKAEQGSNVTLVGHANDNGSRSFNLAVADARIQSVSIILKKFGVKPFQIKKRNVGSESLPNACRSVSCRQLMRRVELLFSTAR